MAMLPLLFLACVPSVFGAGLFSQIRQGYGASQARRSFTTDRQARLIPYRPRQARLAPLTKFIEYSDQLDTTSEYFSDIDKSSVGYTDYSDSGMTQKKFNFDATRPS